MNKIREFFKPKKPLAKWWVGRIFLLYIFIALIASSGEVINPIFNRLNKMTSPKPSDAQWEGYSDCLIREKNETRKEYICRKRFNIPY